MRGPPITVKPHEESRSDRMQRHRTEREIIDCNMITRAMMMAKMEGLKGSSMPLLAAAVGWGNAFVEKMETGLWCGFFSNVLPPLVQRGGGYATTCTEKSGQRWRTSVNQAALLKKGWSSNLQTSINAICCHCYSCRIRFSQLHILTLWRHIYKIICKTKNPQDNTFVMNSHPIQTQLHIKDY